MAVSLLLQDFTLQFHVLPLNHVVASVTDPGSGDPLHPEEHKEEPWRQRLAVVEAVHHRQASDRDAAHRGTDPRQGREFTHTDTH